MSSNLANFLQSFESNAKDDLPNDKGNDSKKESLESIMVDDVTDEEKNSISTNEMDETNASERQSNAHKATEEKLLNNSTDLEAKPSIKIKRIRISKKQEKSKDSPLNSSIERSINAKDDNKPEHSTANDANDSDVNDKENKEPNLDQLFAESGTPYIFREKWMEIYKKAEKSGKTTLTNAKVKAGKFRLDEAGKMEILPDFNTYGKTSNQLLHENWNINK